MKRLLNKFGYILATLWLSAASLFIAVPQASAASASLSLSPGSTTATQGSIVSLGIYVNSGSQPIYAAQANLSYPANLLDYVGVTSSGSFSIEAQTSGGGGSAVVARGTLAPTTGNALLATIRFKAKTSSGTATVNFTSASSVPGDGGVSILAGTAGANIVLKAAPAAAPKAAAAPAPPKDTTPPTISNVDVSDITNNTATVNWTTSEPATSEVSYGATTKYGWSVVNTSPVTEHKVAIDSTFLEPGTTYHYVVKSVDPAGNAVVGTDQTFKTSGLSLTVTVLDQNSKAVSGAKVNFQKQTVTTDKNGKATFKDLNTQSGNAIVTYNGKQAGAYVNVTPTSDSQASPVTLKVKLPTSSSKAPMYGLIALAILIIGGLLYLVSRGRNGNQGGGSGVITPVPVLPSTDPDLKTGAGVMSEEFKPTPTPPVQDNEPVVIKPDNPVGSDSDEV